MRIEEVTIAGYRGFKDELAIKMHPQVNVFVGANGSGKTTILEAVAGLLQVFVSQLKEQTPSGFEYSLEAADIHYQEKSLMNSIKLFLKTSPGELSQFIHFSVTQTIYGEPHLDGNLSDYVNNWQYQLANRIDGLPILIYYPTNRLFSSEKLRKKNQSTSILHSALETYDNALDSKINSFSDFEVWYIENENRENRIRLREDDKYRLPRLEIIRKAIRLFFTELHAETTYEGPFVDEVDKESKLFLKKNGAIYLQLDKLSDGEKVLLLLVSDIARRLALAVPPPREILDLGNPGIVLVDELELHLHPSWQRTVIPALTNVFPNIQFIFTTHSPQVLSNLKRENIHVIEDFKLVEEIAPVYGEDSNSILWEIFGVKKQPEHSERAFSEFYRLLELDATKAKKTLDSLEKTYGSEHSEVIKAKQEFDFEFGKYSSQE